MNIPTLIIVFILAVSAKIALGQMYKNGTCIGCPEAKNCPGKCGSVNKKKKKGARKSRKTAKNQEK